MFDLLLLRYRDIRLDNLSITGDVSLLKRPYNKVLNSRCKRLTRIVTIGGPGHVLEHGLYVIHSASYSLQFCHQQAYDVGVGWVIKHKIADNDFLERRC